MSSPRKLFDRLRARARTGILVEGLAVLVAAFVVYMGVSFAADRSLRLEVGFRVVLLAILGVTLVRLVYARVMTPLAVELDDREMALAVERADPGLRQALISAVQFEDTIQRGGRLVESRALMDTVVRDVHHRVDAMDTRRAVDRGRVSRYAGVLLAGLLIVGGWIAYDPGTVKLWAMRNLGLSSIEWPRATLLAFLDAGAERTLRIPEGDDLTLRVAATGVVPEQVFLHYEFAGGESGTDSMTLTGDREFTLTMQSVLEGVVVWADGGDGLTDRVTIELVERPRVTHFEVALDYPAYMKREPAVVPESQGDIRVPRGGSLRLRGQTTKRLATATLLFGKDGRSPARVASDGMSFEARFAPEATGLLALSLVDIDQLDAAQPTKLFLRVVEDRKPRVEFKAIGVGSMITPIARIPGELRVKDDYGVTALDAQFRLTASAASEAPDDDPLRDDPQQDDPKKEDPKKEAAPAEPPFEAADVNGLQGFKPGGTTFESMTLFDLKPMVPDEDRPASARNRVRPGMFVSLRYRARDNFGPGDPHTGESEVLTFRVVTQEKLLEDISRRQSEARRALKQVLEEVTADRNELREILAPTAADPKAARAKNRVIAMAREQRALGKRVLGVAQRYTRILQELLNNRIMSPNNVAKIEALIPAPLMGLAEEDFPSSAGLVQEFALSGEEDVRIACVSAYESVIKTLERVLKEMQEMENLATLLEGLRQVIKVQDTAIDGARKRRDAEAGSAFTGPDGKKPKKNQPENPGPKGTGKRDKENR